MNSGTIGTIMPTYTKKIRATTVTSTNGRVTRRCSSVLKIRLRRHRVHPGVVNGWGHDGIPRLTEVTSTPRAGFGTQERRTSTETVRVCGDAGPIVTPRNGATSA